MYGIDVSFHKDFPDWSQVRDKLDFAILAITELYEGIDKTFEHNYQGCKDNGILVGAYSYNYAVSGAEAREKAKLIIDTLAGRPLDLPIFLDLEEESQKSLPQSRINAIIENFRQVIEDAGYRFGIYVNGEWYYQYLPDYAKTDYPIWYSWPASTDNTCPTEKKPSIPNMIGWQYSWKGHLPGFGDHDIDMDIWYEGDVTKEEATAEDVLNVARGWLGRNQADGSHKEIIDIYNKHSPLAQGYKVAYSDSWCDAFVSACFIKLGASGIIGGTECGVERHVALFKAAGIWIEDGTITPPPGYIIVFNWDESTQPNDGFADHIGIVEFSDAGKVHTIEGNASGAVKRREYAIGDGNIRGYASPMYGTARTGTETGTETNTGTATPSIIDDRPMLQTGSMGIAVENLQLILGAKVTGIFDEALCARVKAYQGANNLEPDGIVGPLTWSALINSINSRKSYDALADEVIKGLWGNGEERRQKLTAEGYDYGAIQAVVNEKMKNR